MPPAPHRKRVKHRSVSGMARELTFSCYRRLPLLNIDEVYAALLSEAVGRATTKQGFDLLAFVFMPEHVHLLVLPRGDAATVSGLLAAIKRPHSYRVKQHMLAGDSPWLGRLTIAERPGKRSFRFWQEGSGYDRDIADPTYLQAVADYFHANPVRRGLCPRPDKWRWSSWRHYHGGDTHGLPRVSGIERV